MEFIGKDTIPAKRLRDVPLSVEEYSKHYVEIIKMIRTMFLQAKLVHGDLSEFNLLYWEGKIIMIDVSQTMEDNHPLAIEFLKRDLYNLNLYFISKSVITFKLRSLFKFVTDP
jgi:RIO kinase 1